MRSGYSRPRLSLDMMLREEKSPALTAGRTNNGYRPFSTTMNPKFEPKELVRRFSEQVRDKLQESGSQDDHELERCLTETLEARESKRRAQIEKIYSYQLSSR